ncbi:hypothetical protein NHQ30_000821 [Ciborinia camelliae]|nr:hypothetical protein NHQ30_000821 [Ciborinia camelliae]
MNGPPTISFNFSTSPDALRVVLGSEVVPSASNGLRQDMQRMGSSHGDLMNQSTREPAAPPDTSPAQPFSKSFSNVSDFEDFSAYLNFPTHSPPTTHPMSKRVDRQEIDPNASFSLSHNHPSSTDTSALKSEIPSPASARNKRRATGPATASNPSAFNMQSGSSMAGPSSAGLDDSNMTSSMAPPAKKSRTNTPWTPAEEQRLKNMRDAGNSWADIAKTFPARTEGSVKKHWYKDMHYAEFAEDESQALLAAIKDYEANKWKAIGQKVGKPAKSEIPSPASARNKRRATGPATASNPSAFNMQSGSSMAGPSSAGLDDSNMTSSMAPPAKKSRTNTPWTPAEEQRLKNMRDAGNSWADIAKTFPARTEGSVKKHWYKDMHYAEFAEDESQALLAAIKDYEANKWKAIGQKVGKPAKVRLDFSSLYEFVSRDMLVSRYV